MAYPKKPIRNRPLEDVLQAAEASASQDKVERLALWVTTWTEMWNREVVPSLSEMKEMLGILDGDHTHVSAGGDVLKSDREIYADCTLGEVVMVAPPAADAKEHHFLFIKTDSTSNDLVVTFADGETVGGELVIRVTAQWAGIEIVSDGAAYAVVFTHP